MTESMFQSSRGTLQFKLRYIYLYIFAKKIKLFIMNNLMQFNNVFQYKKKCNDSIKRKLLSW